MNKYNIYAIFIHLGKLHSVHLIMKKIHNFINTKKKLIWNWSCPIMKFNKSYSHKLHNIQYFIKYQTLNNHLLSSFFLNPSTADLQLPVVGYCSAPNLEGTLRLRTRTTKNNKNKFLQSFMNNLPGKFPLELSNISLH